MYDKYLVTGTTGFLGRAVVEALARRGTRVYALVLHDDPYINLLPKEVHTVIGDVCEKLTDRLLRGCGQPYLCDSLRRYRLCRVQTRFEALSGQCRGDMESSPAMYGA